MRTPFGVIGVGSGELDDGLLADDLRLEGVVEPDVPAVLPDAGGRPDGDPRRPPWAGFGVQEPGEPQNRAALVARARVGVARVDVGRVPSSLDGEIQELGDRLEGFSPRRDVDLSARREDPEDPVADGMDSPVLGDSLRLGRRAVRKDVQRREVRDLEDVLLGVVRVDGLDDLGACRNRCCPRVPGVAQQERLEIVAENPGGAILEGAVCFERCAEGA